eukprot:UC1_evm1s2023
MVSTARHTTIMCLGRGQSVLLPLLMALATPLLLNNANVVYAISGSNPCANLAERGILAGQVLVDGMYALSSGKRVWCADMSEFSYYITVKTPKGFINPMKKINPSNSADGSTSVGGFTIAGQYKPQYGTVDKRPYWRRVHTDDTGSSNRLEIYLRYSSHWKWWIFDEEHNSHIWSVAWQPTKSGGTPDPPL